MTVTLNSDCSAFSVATTNFTVSPADLSRNLTVKFNCTTTYPVISIGTGTTSPYSLTPAALGLTDTTFPNGPYHLSLVTTTSAGSELKEEACALSLCGLQCDLLDSYGVVADFPKVLAFEALKLAPGCTSCDCTTACTLYNIVTTDSTDDTSCGCSQA